MEGIVIERLPRLTRTILQEFINREASQDFPIGCNRCGIVGGNLFTLRGEILCFTHYELKRLGLK